MRYEFMEHNVNFFEYAKIEYYENLMLTLPILVYNNKNLLFKAELHLPKVKVSDLKKYSKYLDAKEFLSIFFPQFLQKLEKKAENWLSVETPSPVLAEDSSAEFLEVDEDTNFYGNVIQNDKEGCHMYYGVNNHYRPLVFDDKLFLNSHYLPRECDNFHDLNREEKLEYIKKLSKKEQIDYYRQIHCMPLHELRQNHLPLFIRLSGNDDTSYTAYFETQEELIGEICRLRRCQPLNKMIDVLNNNYYVL